MFEEKDVVLSEPSNLPPNVSAPESEEREQVRATPGFKG